MRRCKEFLVAGQLMLLKNQLSNTMTRTANSCYHLKTEPLLALKSRNSQVNLLKLKVTGEINRRDANIPKNTSKASPKKTALFSNLFAESSHFQHMSASSIGMGFLAKDLCLRLEAKLQVCGKFR